MAPNLKKMLIIFITGINSNPNSPYCVLWSVNRMLSVNPSHFKSCLYFANCICQLVRIQGRNWLPKTGWASSKAARCCFCRCIKILPQNVWAIAQSAHPPFTPLEYHTFLFLPHLFDLFIFAKSRSRKHNGLIDTSYLVFKYAMVGRAF